MRLADIDRGRPLGTDSHSVVFEGMVGQQAVAVKCQLPESAAQIPAARLSTDVPRLFEIQHDALPKFLGVAKPGAEPAWCAMEFVPGIDFCNFMASHDRVSESRLLDWTRSLASGLAEFHRRGIAHGCVSSRAIRISPNGTQAKLVDIGLFDPLPRPFDRDQAYVAPELLSLDARVTPAADMYALGRWLYDASTWGDVQRVPYGRCNDLSRLLMQEDPKMRPTPLDLVDVLGSSPIEVRSMSAQDYIDPAEVSPEAMKALAEADDRDQRWFETLAKFFQELTHESVETALKAHIKGAGATWVEDAGQVLEELADDGELDSAALREEFQQLATHLAEAEKLDPSYLQLENQHVANLVLGFWLDLVDERLETENSVDLDASLLPRMSDDEQEEFSTILNQLPILKEDVLSALRALGKAIIDSQANGTASASTIVLDEQGTGYRAVTKT